MTNSPGELLQEIAELSKRLNELGVEGLTLSAQRRDIVVDLYASGYSHAQLAVAMGVSRGRVFQILHAPGTAQQVGG